MHRQGSQCGEGVVAVAAAGAQQPCSSGDSAPVSQQEDGAASLRNELAQSRQVATISDCGFPCCGSGGGGGGPTLPPRARKSTARNCCCCRCSDDSAGPSSSTPTS